MTTDKKTSQRETLAAELFDKWRLDGFPHHNGRVELIIAIALDAAAMVTAAERRASFEKLQALAEPGVEDLIQQAIDDAAPGPQSGPQSALMFEQMKNDERWRVAHRSIRAMFKAVGATDPGRFETPNHTLVDLGRLREWMELPGPDSFHAHAARLKEMGITMVR